MKKVLSVAILAIIAAILSFATIAAGVLLGAFVWLLWPVVISVPLWLACKVVLPMFTIVKLSWLQAFCVCIIAKIIRVTFSRRTVINNTTKQSDES